jgi:hypothetical protein
VRAGTIWLLSRSPFPMRPVCRACSASATSAWLNQAGRVRGRGRIGRDPARALGSRRLLSTKPGKPGHVNEPVHRTSKFADQCSRRRIRIRFVSPVNRPRHTHRGAPPRREVGTLSGPLLARSFRCRTQRVTRIRDRNGCAAPRRCPRVSRFPGVPGRRRLPRPACPCHARCVARGPNTGFTIATPIGLLVASVFAAASCAGLAPDRARGFMRRSHLLLYGLLALLVAWGAASLVGVPPLDDPAPSERASGPLVVPAVSGFLYGAAIARYQRLPRPVGSAKLLVAMAAALCCWPKRGSRLRSVATGTPVGGSGTCSCSRHSPSSRTVPIDNGTRSASPTYTWRKPRRVPVYQRPVCRPAGIHNLL